MGRINSIQTGGSIHIKKGRLGGKTVLGGKETKSIRFLAPPFYLKKKTIFSSFSPNGLQYVPISTMTISYHLGKRCQGDGAKIPKMPIITEVTDFPLRNICGKIGSFVALNP
jgi:hypothetical protein